MQKSNSLKDAAFEYWQLGHRIVPIIIEAEKIPLVEWKRRQNEEQSARELHELVNGEWKKVKQ